MHPQFHGYDCLADPRNWQAGWSRAKQTWCCEEHGLGCRAAEMADLPQPTAVQSDTSVVAIHFDCASAIQTWETSWSAWKKQWCCQTTGEGCQPAGATVNAAAGTVYNKASIGELYDCRVAYANWAAEWSESKKAYCCSTARLGCASSKPTAAPVSAKVPDTQIYECTVTEYNPVSSWTSAKRGWCCENSGTGCFAVESPGTTTRSTLTTTLPYNCDVDTASWQSTWAEGQKAWCCMHLHKGCPNRQPRSASKSFENKAEKRSPLSTADGPEDTFAARAPAHWGKALSFSVIMAGFGILGNKIRKQTCQTTRLEPGLHTATEMDQELALQLSGGLE